MYDKIANAQDQLVGTTLQLTQEQVALSAHCLDKEIVQHILGITTIKMQDRRELMQYLATCRTFPPLETTVYQPNERYTPCYIGSCVGLLTRARKSNVSISPLPKRFILPLFSVIFSH